MPRGRFFSVSVLVGDDHFLEELYQDDRHYVDSSVVTNDSYRMLVEEEGCEVPQELTVTPYKLLILADNNAPTCFYQVHIDGVKVATPLVHAGKMSMIQGIRCGRTMEELVFSVPTEGKAKLGKGAASQVGEIQVFCIEGLYAGVVDFSYNTRQVACHHDGSIVTQRTGSGWRLAGATKKDAGIAGEGMMMTTRQGRTLFNFEPSTARSTERMWFNKGPLLDEIHIYYRPQATLQLMGLLPVQDDYNNNAVMEEGMDTSEEKDHTHTARKRAKLGRFSMGGGDLPSDGMDLEHPLPTDTDQRNVKLGRFSMGGDGLPEDGGDSGAGTTFTAVQKNGKLGRYSMGGDGFPPAADNTSGKLGRYSMGGGSGNLLENTADEATTSGRQKQPKLGRYSMGGDGSFPESQLTTQLGTVTEESSDDPRKTPEMTTSPGRKLMLFSPSESYPVSFDEALEEATEKMRVLTPSAKRYSLARGPKCEGRLDMADMPDCRDKLFLYDDDVYVIEDDDSDVECLGDSDCLVLEVASDETPVIDLLNETLMNTTISPPDQRALVNPRF